MLYARAGDETQGDLTDVATAPHGECLSRRRGGLGDLFLQEKKKSGAFSSPLKKLCLFGRRKELRMLARRLGAFTEKSLWPVTGGGEGTWGTWGPGQVEECAALAALCLCPAGFVALGCLVS